MQTIGKGNTARIILQSKDCFQICDLFHNCRVESPGQILWSPDWWDGSLYDLCLWACSVSNTFSVILLQCYFEESCLGPANI